MKAASTVVKAFVHRQLLREMLRPLAAFGTVITLGVAGFSSVEGVGIVDALFWLLDPSSIVLHFQNHDGPATMIKAYAIVVVTALLVSSLWIGETMLSAAFGGQITSELQQMEMERDIDAVNSHTIVCGYGTFGKTVGEQLAEDFDVVVIEAQEDRYQRAVEDGLLTVRGDAREEETLVAAGVERATTVIGAIDDTNANIQIAIAASQLAPTVRLIVRAGNAREETLARRAGADDVIIPEVLSGKRVSEELEQ